MQIIRTLGRTPFPYRVQLSKTPNDTTLRCHAVQLRASQPTTRIKSSLRGKTTIGGTVRALRDACFTRSARSSTEACAPTIAWRIATPRDEARNASELQLTGAVGEVSHRELNQGRLTAISVEFSETSWVNSIFIRLLNKVLFIRVAPRASLRTWL